MYGVTENVAGLTCADTTLLKINSNIIQIVLQKVFFNISIPFLTAPSPLNETDYQDDNGNDQYDVNKPSQRVTGYQPQQPQNYQYNSNCPQHVILLSHCSFPLPAIASPYQPAVII